MTIPEDLATRFPKIHWPDGLSPASADLPAHNDIIADLLCSVVLAGTSEGPLMAGASAPAFWRRSHV